jgi:RNA polymerase sigma-70 factor (ECF subfamily)
MDALADPYRVAETEARESYGRLVAYLSARSRDVAAAEDALGEAFRSALETWPRDGVPDRPEAWLLAVARRQLIDESRHDRVKAAALPWLRHSAERKQTSAVVEETDSVFPDERLKLLFVCAHPQIDPAARTPLMLQTVLGLDAARIASAFLVAPATMGQRLVRAKAKIRDAQLPFDVPGAADLPARLAPVLDAVYAAYGAGWDDANGVDPRRSGLASEAIHLARILASLIPTSAEAHGLLALLLHCEARRAARRSPDGAYVPLAEQDVALWSHKMIAEAEHELTVASSLGAIGPFQLEAAIQSVHAERAFTGETDWNAVALFYDELVRRAPTLGALVGRAAALGKARGLGLALEALDVIDARSTLNYQPYWAVRAHTLAELGESEAAGQAFAHAIGLSEDPQVRAFLIRSRDRLSAADASDAPSHARRSREMFT